MLGVVQKASLLRDPVHMGSVQQGRPQAVGTGALAGDRGKDVSELEAQEMLRLPRERQIGHDYGRP